LAGRLEFVDNAVDRQTGTILLKAVFPNDDGALWPGQFVTVGLTLAVQAGATVVPNEAIQSGQKGPYVFVVRSDRTVEMRPVRPGLTGGPFTVIEEGLSPGEEVVTDGHLRLFPGAPVELKTAGSRS
jgi:multidrug efflux system membrane fusion protein